MLSRKQVEALVCLRSEVHTWYRCYWDESLLPLKAGQESHQ
jgi:hypothetical protein